jgi:adenosylcobinamide-GDP ribazoletransferase
MRMLTCISAAFQFLTILPLPVKTERRHLEKSMVWFPMVGAVIGIITGFAFQGLHALFPASISSALTIFIYIILTRALHLDGFMDTIDGFFSFQDRESILRIMKTPTVGSFAVLGVGVWFLVLFSSIPMLGPKDLIIIHTYLRTAILLMPLLFSYPRGSGTGKFLVDHVKDKTALLAIILTLMITAALYFIDIPGSQWTVNKRLQILLYGAFLLVSFFVAWLIGLWSKKKIGGITGDIMGFTIETTHLLLVLLIVCVGRRA